MADADQWPTLFYEKLNGVERTEQINLYEFENYNDFFNYAAELVYGDNPVNGVNAAAPGNEVQAENVEVAPANGNRNVVVAVPPNPVNINVEALAAAFGEIVMTWTDHVGVEQALNLESEWSDVLLFGDEIHAHLE